MHDSVTHMLLLNCALKLVEEIILYYDARSKKHKKMDIYRSVNISFHVQVSAKKSPVHDLHIQFKYESFTSFLRSVVHERGYVLFVEITARYGTVSFSCWNASDLIVVFCTDKSRDSMKNAVKRARATRSSRSNVARDMLRCTRRHLKYENGV